MKKIMLLLIFVISTYISSDIKNDLEEQITPLMQKVIEWRHDIHQYPELSNREFNAKVPKGNAINNQLGKL